MTNIDHIINYVLSFKPYVLLPMILFGLSMILRISVTKALRASLTIGIGFIGIFLVFGYFVEKVGSVISAIANNSGIKRNVFDVGWPPLASVAWSFKLLPVVIILIIIVNVLMLFLKLTKTANIDIWNFWHFIFLGVLVYTSTQNAVLSVVSILAVSVVCLKIADWCAKDVQVLTGMKGVTTTTFSGIIYYPVGVVLGKAIDKVPYVRKMNADTESIKNKLGLAGEPMFIGFILGMILGLLGRYNVKDTLELAFNFAAVIFILPNMCGILGGGLVVISEGMQKFVGRMSGRGETHIGLDLAFLLANPTVIVTGLLLMPVAMALALLLPGINFIPLGDLVSVITLSSIIVAGNKGNIVRAAIISIPLIIANLYVASSMAGTFTGLVHKFGVDLEGYQGTITSFLDGGNPFRYWLFKVFEGNVPALLMIPLFVMLLFGTYRICSRER